MLSESGMKRVLILGGTAEARVLAERLAARPNLRITLSLAGRTAAPAPQPVPVRRGGFGGATGLADYLTGERIDALVVATHPYAAIIAANAVSAAAAANVPMIVVHRPAWPAVAGDRWTEVDGVRDAVRVIGERPRRVFVALGRNELAAFAAAPQHHYLIRSVDPVDPPLAVSQAVYVTGRGPFTEEEDRALMAAHGIEFLVAKNSGGHASYGKIAAARALGINVIMLRRPPVPDTPRVATIDAALAWLDHALTSAIARGV
jgi:precorrin-6A/cobalt-precorrin-6A reductase